MPTALYKPRADENRFSRASKKSGDARDTVSVRAIRFRVYPAGGNFFFVNSFSVFLDFLRAAHHF